MNRNARTVLLFGNMRAHVECMRPYARNLMQRAARFPESLTEAEHAEVKKETERRKVAIRRQVNALVAGQSLRLIHVKFPPETEEAPVDIHFD